LEGKSKIKNLGVSHLPEKSSSFRRQLGDIGSKSSMAAPSWAARYRIELARFNVRRRYAGKRPIPHHQGFDVYISNITSFQMQFSGLRQRVTG